jgi:type IX secretion system PorP/SprF family membrane protein
MTQISKILVVFALLFTGLVYGQQDPHYTQYMYNQNILNPAYAGSGSELSVALLGRTQWVGIEGAPDTQTLNIHSQLGSPLGMGVGLSVLNDQIGPAKETNIGLDASYTFQVSEQGLLSFGLKGTYNMLRVDLNGGVLTNDEGDVLFAEDVQDNAPNVGAGLYFRTDRFYAGLSVPNILENHIYTLVSDNDIQDVSDKMHWFGTLGYVFDLNENLKLKPSTMVKMVQGAPISLDLNASLFINDKFEIGLSWREGDSIDAIIGIQASPDIRIGYAYDHTLTNLGDYNSGSHELMLLFDLNFNKKFIKSPRFF